MTFIEALEKVFEGHIIQSFTGKTYDSSILNPKRLSSTCIVTNAVTTEKERKSKDWKLITVQMQ